MDTIGTVTKCRQDCHWVFAQKTWYFKNVRIPGSLEAYRKLMRVLKRIDLMRSVKFYEWSSAPKLQAEVYLFSPWMSFIYCSFYADLRTKYSYLKVYEESESLFITRGTGSIWIVFLICFFPPVHIFRIVRKCLNFNISYV